MLEKTRAIVVRTVRHTESQLIADLYTEARGRVAVLVRFGKSRAARQLRALLAPWTALDCVLDYRPGRQLQRLAEATALLPWASLDGDAPRATVALFLAEVTAQAVRAESPDAPLFAFLIESVERLALTGSAMTGSAGLRPASLSGGTHGLAHDAGRRPALPVIAPPFGGARAAAPPLTAAPVAGCPCAASNACRRPALSPNFTIAFLLTLTRHLGFMPAPSDWRPGLSFDLRTGEFTAQAPPHPDVLTPTEAALMHRALAMTFRTAPLFRLGRDGRARVLDLLMRYFAIHLPAFRQPRSLDVVREVFA